jgi:hypothetical protein
MQRQCNNHANPVQPQCRSSFWRASKEGLEAYPGRPNQSIQPSCTRVGLTTRQVSWRPVRNRHYRQYERDGRYAGGAVFAGTVSLNGLYATVFTSLASVTPAAECGKGAHAGNRGVDRRSRRRAPAVPAHDQRTICRVPRRSGSHGLLLAQETREGPSNPYACDSGHRAGQSIRTSQGPIRRTCERGKQSCSRHRSSVCFG